MKLKNKYSRSIILYLLFILPFLISLSFYYFAINNKKFQGYYELKLKPEILVDDVLKIYTIEMLMNNKDRQDILSSLISTKELLSIYAETMKDMKYSNDISNIIHIKKKKK